jgi:hypothetical protein
MRVASSTSPTLVPLMAKSRTLIVRTSVAQGAAGRHQAF